VRARRPDFRTLTLHDEMEFSMFRRIAMCVVATVALASQATAQLPPVMRHVPPDALATVVIPSIDQLDRSVSGVTAALEMPAAASPKQMLAMMGLREGVDFTRPVAIVIGGNVMEMGDDAVVLLAPTTDYAAMIAQFQPEQQNGLDAFEMNGTRAFAKPLADGYALIGPSADVISNFEGGMDAGAMADAVGRAGLAVAEKSDIYIVANMPAIAEMVRPMLAEARGELAQQGAALAAMSGQDPEQFVQQMMASFDFIDEFMAQAGGSVVGASAGPLGVSFDKAVSFRDGTQMAGWFGAPGDSSRLLQRLPDKPFLLAGAADLSSPGMQDAMEAYAKFAKGAALGMPGLENIDMEAALTNLNGYAFSAYQNPAGLMGGLFAGAMVFVDSDDPGALRGFIRDTLATLGNMEGAPFTTRFNEGAVEVNGGTADSWGMTVQPDPANPMGAQAMQLMFGPGGGPSGLLATVEGGVLMTYSQNSQSLADAMSANAENSLGGNQLLAQVAANLPEPRTAEMYYGVQSILEQVTPFLAMFLGPMDVMPDEPLPPVGMGISTGAGAFHLGVFVPMPVIRTAVDGAAQIQELQQGDEGGDENPPF
jgi:hypothetical protein